ncbi:sphingomyelin phosphodiesterase 5-like [Mauremys reevesii]|uniref:sphingomyelin phosphodiesterase 5-like n=1 Tax=Mauremys reevesii TaxID=260615 RepID=UPI00193F59AF|nr:sphingomyelin phosphodiesterase 5-like [Mauremys reevesii]XP_039377122.1 sphingomyelin phosphodiesterase 5-like [Mauremys reevesii]XP_039377123.1 sphingomyelin phosphodiesterase 5-like [Mauremys reevesii]XP_039377124.1 sphingomyelin phosphodiesterase 5-like [Mauremys reevesii]XP_039377128.1 sphingomyelin phosphodiesterase 5-like [Mauremys reevesii]XP_039377129.1 sphingomyelin phosphodiesterase 5-like [Mauremys reevesii]
MVLRESPFPNRLLSGLYSLGQFLLFPSYWATDCLLDLRETTAERQQHRCCPLRALLTGPLLLLLLILSMPGALLGLLLWLPLQAARRPFAYKHNVLSRHPEVWELPGKSKAFGFVSANVCLLPNGLAKFSNLGQMKQRVARIGQRLTQGEAGASFASPRSSQFLLPSKYGATAASPPRPESHARRPGASVVIEVPDGEGEAGPGEISVPFPPDVDFVCLQEVFDQRAGARLCQLLSPFYEHIVYDVGAYGLQGCCTLKVFGSGLFLASRYPVLAAQYRCYPECSGEDALSAKGLLSVQVELGAADGQRIVGYLNCTHLHAPAADAQIRCSQLTQGLFWAQLFQDTHTQHGDVVAFDVFCGDFNFDNCSSGDELEQTHEIFRQYQDPCRVGPRQDRPWAIGTLLNYLHIHEEAVSTPEKLKRTLEQEEGRRTYLAGPILQDGRPDPSAAGSPWEGRRIDYILYREHPAPISLTTEVETFSFITQLAGCSDHMAVGLRLLLNPAPQWQQQV